MPNNIDDIYAGSFKRIISVIIDIAFLAFIGSILLKIGILELLPHKQPVGLKYVIFLCSVYLIFYILPMGIFSQTLGCHLTGIRVVTKKLEHLGLKSFKRNLLNYLLLNVIGVLYLFSGNKKNIDNATNTIVIVASRHKKTRLVFLDYVLFWLFFVTAISFPVVWLKLYHSKSIKVRALDWDISNYKNQKDEFHVRHVAGDVKLLRRGERKKLKLKDQLRSNDTISTKQKSFAIILYKNEELTNSYKIGEHSDIKLSSFKTRIGKKEISGQSILLNLGRTLIDVKNKTKDERVRVETKAVVLGVRGTRFIVDVSDLGTRLFVKEGIVNVYNKSTRAEQLVTSGMYMNIQNNGESRKLNKDNYNIDWEINNSFNFLETKINKAEKIKTVKNTDANNLEKILRLIKLEIEKDIKVYKKNKSKISTMMEELNKIDILLKAKNNIIKDLKCLKSNQTCKLRMEKVLIKRGFPIIKFTSKLRKSMGDELKLYFKELKEQKVVVEKNTYEIQSQNRSLKNKLKKITKQYKDARAKILNKDSRAYDLISDLVKVLNKEFIKTEFKKIQR